MRSVALLAAGSFGAAAILLASPASAAQSYDPNVARTANPANICKSIPGTIEYAEDLFEVDIDTSGFDYSGCVANAAHGDAMVPGWGDPYEQCDLMVSEGWFSYPAVMHSEPGDPLPDLKVNNRKQCGNALYAFHAIATSVFGAE